MPDALLIVLAAALVLLALGWYLYAIALRVDRLHRQVLGSRATLEAQLVHRGQASERGEHDGGDAVLVALRGGLRVHSAGDGALAPIAG